MSKPSAMQELVLQLGNSRADWPLMASVRLEEPALARRICQGKRTAVGQLEGPWIVTMLIKS